MELQVSKAKACRCFLQVAENETKCIAHLKHTRISTKLSCNYNSKVNPFSWTNGRIEVQVSQPKACNCLLQVAKNKTEYIAT